jgi:transposase-like protein
VSCSAAKQPIHPGRYVTLQEASAIVELHLGYRNNRWLHEHSTCKRRMALGSETSRSGRDFGTTLFCLSCLYELAMSQRQLRLSV